MSDTVIQKDIVALLATALPVVPVFDSHANATGSTYITFAPFNSVANHFKNLRSRIVYVTLHIWMKDAAGSVAARLLAEDVIEALDNKKLTESETDCYFTDSLSVKDPDEITQHVIVRFQVR